MEANEILKSICDDVELISGIKTVIWDKHKNMIHTQPNGMCDFCAEVRKSPVLAKKCRECDLSGFAGCTPDRDIHIYRCHMGLVEAIAPITENGLPVGYLMLGQLLPEGERETVASRIDALDEPSNKLALHRSLSLIKETNEEQLRAAVRILAMCASYVRMNALLQRQKSSVVREIEQYVAAHLSDAALTIAIVCKALGLSRTALYTACREGFGMGLGGYIVRARTDRAITLLKTTEQSLSDIANAVGISSTDYLTKLIKKQTGLSPKAIRLQAK
ncbi:MAG: PocR ligand-binding domain-containing protein [Clostridia bacterium]|nr:PocR ligand-binding domain-containing protein [Clostridia bacterium]